MKPREIAICLIAKDLGVNFKSFKTDFNQRFKLQKLMFLAFQTNQFKDLSCSFGLYIHGPYSPELTKIGYEISDSLKVLENNSLNDKGDRQVEALRKGLPQQVREIINKKNELGKKDKDILEAFTTLVMMCKNFSLVDNNVSNYKDYLISNFKNLKNINLSEKEISELFDQARNFLSLD